MGLIDRALLDVQRRFETMQRRMAPGSLGGRTDTASPVSPAAKGVATPQTRATTTANGLSALLTVRVTASTQQLTTGASGDEVTWDEVDPGSFGTAISWASGAPTIVDINEDGFYRIDGGFVVADVFGSEGPVWGGWAEYSRGADGTWAYGGSYMKTTALILDTHFAIGSHCLPLEAGDTIVSVIAHDVRLGGVLRSPSVVGADSTTYLTISKVG